MKMISGTITLKEKNHLRKIGGKYCHKGSKLNNEALSQSSSFECL